MKQALLLLLAACGLLASCSQNLKSESGLYDVELVHSYKMAVDGAWTHGKGNPYAHRKAGSICVSPLWVTPDVAAEEPELSLELIRHMDGYMENHLGRALAEANKANGTEWRIVPGPQGADVRIDLAIVRLKKQKPGLNILSQVAGVASPVPGVSTVLGKAAKGDICIEGSIRDCRTGKLLLAFKDSNRKSVHLYQKSAYSQSGQADASLDKWAEDIARLIRECAYDRLGEGSLRNKVEQRGVGGAVKARLNRL